MDKQFAGDKKVGKSFFWEGEHKLADYSIRRMPACIETYHLTLTTALWGVLMILFGWLAKNNLFWMWACALMIGLQYWTDLCDGKLGKARNTGLIRWGFYADHLLDFFFMGCMLASYYFILPKESHFYLFLSFIVFGMFMVNSFLSFSALNEFKIEFFKIGPTEARLMIIIFNLLLPVGLLKYFIIAFPYLLGLSVVSLLIVVFRIHRRIWKVDMDIKKADESNKSNGL